MCRAIIDSTKAADDGAINYIVSSACAWNPSAIEQLHFFKRIIIYSRIFSNESIFLQILAQTIEKPRKPLPLYSASVL